MKDPTGRARALRFSPREKTSTARNQVSTRSSQESKELPPLPQAVLLLQNLPCFAVLRFSDGTDGSDGGASARPWASRLNRWLKLVLDAAALDEISVRAVWPWDSDLIERLHESHRYVELGPSVVGLFCIGRCHEIPPEPDRDIWSQMTQYLIPNCGISRL